MKPTILTLALFLAGCTSGPFIVQRGSDAYDEAVAASELTLCRAYSVGSILRRYAVSPEMWDAWLTLCGYRGVGDIARPEVQ